MMLGYIWILYNTVPVAYHLSTYFPRLTHVDSALLCFAVIMYDLILPVLMVTTMALGNLYDAPCHESNVEENE